jgi:hypothetical protein
VNHLTKKITKPHSKPPEHNNHDRETKILNLICNTSLLLMALVTEAFSEMFTNLSKEMITALTTSLGATDSLQEKLPQHLREELIAMKKDLSKQLTEKREEITPLLADTRFDTGITIVERTPLPLLPPLTQDLDERSLLSYLILLQTNDPHFTRMFQELLEWMKTIPQPAMKK